MSADRISHHHIRFPRARLFGAMAILALLIFTVQGCGLNASSSSGQTDSNAAPPSAAPGSVAMTPTPQTGTPMMPPMMTPMSPGTPPPGMDPGATGEDTAQAAEAAMRQQAGANFGGSPPPGAGAAAIDPAQMEAQMRAQQGVAVPGGNGADDPAEMQRRMEEQMRQQRGLAGNAGGGIAGADGNGAAALGAGAVAGFGPGGPGGAAAGGAIAGPGGQYGGRGGEGGGGEFKEGDAEYIVIKFANAVRSDDFETAGKCVSEKATGLLAAVRKGEMSDNQKQQLKSYVSELKHIGSKATVRTKTANFNGGSNKVLSFKIEKSGEEFVISDLDIHDAPRPRARTRR